MKRERESRERAEREGGNGKLIKSKTDKQTDRQIDRQEERKQERRPRVRTKEANTKRKRTQILIKTSLYLFLFGNEKTKSGNTEIGGWMQSLQRSTSNLSCCGVRDVLSKLTFRPGQTTPSVSSAACRQARRHSGSVFKASVSSAREEGSVPGRRKKGTENGREEGGKEEWKKERKKRKKTKEGRKNERNKGMKEGRKEERKKRKKECKEERNKQRKKNKERKKERRKEIKSG